MRFFVRLAALAALVVASAPAQTQEGEVANNTRFGDWIVACEAVSTQRTSCRITQTQTVAETGQLVLRMVAFPAADGGALFVAQVPMGVYLPSGAVYALAGDGDAPQREMVWQRCAGQICEAAIQMDADEVATVTQAGQILLGYRLNPGEEPIVVGVNVETFSDALDALRPE